MEILTQRTCIKVFTPGDAPEVFSCISAEVTRYMAWEPSPTEAALPMFGTGG